MAIHTYKDAKGRTRYRVTFRRDGRRLADTRLPASTTKAQAEQYDAFIVGQWFNSQRLGIQEIPLIAEVIMRYEQTVIPGLRSPSFAKDCIRAAAPYVIGRRMDNLPQCAEKMRQGLRNGETTIIHRLRFLKTLAHYAVKWGMVDRDYGVTIQIPTPHNSRHYYPQKAEVAQILRGMSQAMRWACWQLYYSGLRRGELWAAEIKGGCYVNATTKNRAPKITPITIPLRKIAGTPTMTKDALSKRFRAAAKAAGYPYRLHDLRHGQASMLLNSGAPLSVVADVLGHKDLKSTRRYAHMLTRIKAEWMNFAATGRQVPDKMGEPAGRRPAPPKKKAA